jgi:hypothetical protein
LQTAELKEGRYLVGKTKKLLATGVVMSCFFAGRAGATAPVECRIGPTNAKDD